MTITTDFTGTENYAERMAGLEAIHDWWFGVGSFAAAATLGQVRANLNTILVGTTILNRETFATWLAKVNTLNEPTDYAAALTFGESQSGALWQCTLPASLRAATDGTGEAAIGGAIARINDSSGNALHLTRDSTSLRPIRGRRPKSGVRNMVPQSGDLASGWMLLEVSVSPNASGDTIFGVVGDLLIPSANAAAHQAYKTLPVVSGKTYTLSVVARSAGYNGLSLRFGGGVSIEADFDLSNGSVHSVAPGGSASVEALGGGVYRCSLTITSAVTASLAVSACPGPVVGSYSNAGNGTDGVFVYGVQLEAGTAATAYQNAGATLFDITEDGVESVSYAAFDLVDDALTTAAIAGGLTGQAFVAGDGGCYVSDLTIVSGGAFNIGGTSHNWTGAAPGILRAVTGGTGRVLDAMLREGAFTEDEIARLERYYRALGGKGLLVPTGPNLVTGGDFSSETGWSVGAGWTISDGTAAFATTGTPSSLSRAIATSVGAWYFMEVDLLTASGEPGPVFVSYAVPPDGVSPALGITPGRRHFVWQASSTSTVVGLRGTVTTVSASFDNLSVRRLIPREDL